MEGAQRGPVLVGNLKITFIFCETIICWRKMQITEQLNLNATSQNK